MQLTQVWCGNLKPSGHKHWEHFSKVVGILCPVVTFLKIQILFWIFQWWKGNWTVLRKDCIKDKLLFQAFLGGIFVIGIIHTRPNKPGHRNRRLQGASLSTINMFYDTYQTDRYRIDSFIRDITDLSALIIFRKHSFLIFYFLFGIYSQWKVYGHIFLTVTFCSAYDC